MSEDFGSYLKHERELRGVPLDEIAQSTKISIRFLRALEESRFADLPGEVFVKGFIRSYGQAVGLNVDELLAAYHESSSEQKDIEDSSKNESHPPREEQLDNRSSFPIGAIFAFGIAALIIFGGVYWFTSEKGKNSEQTQTATPSVVDNSLPAVDDDAMPTVPEDGEPSLLSGSTVSQSPSEPQIEEQPSDISTQATSNAVTIKNTVTVPEKDDIIKDLQDQVVPDSMEPISEVAMGESSLTLVIQVTENSWFNLRIDDQRDQDFILPPGGSKTLQAKNAIVVTIGNRRATLMTLNGQQLDLPESPDNVIRNLTVNAEHLN